MFDSESDCCTAPDRQPNRSGLIVYGSGVLGSELTVCISKPIADSWEEFPGCRADGFTTLDRMLHALFDR